MPEPEINQASLLALMSDFGDRDVYSDVKVGEVTALVGSHGWVEIAINSGNASSQLQINWQDALQVLFLQSNQTA